MSPSILQRRSVSSARRRFRAAAVPSVLSIVSAAIVAGCGADAPPLGREPVKQVYTVENNADGLRIWTETKARADVLVHIDAAADISVYPRSHMDSIEDAAKHLRRGDASAIDAIFPIVERDGVATVGYVAGMYKRIVWIIPTTKATAEEPLDTYRRFFVESRKFPPASIGGFAVEGKVVAGDVAGIPLTIARLEDLSIGSGETAIIDIDLRYFQLRATQDPNYRTGMKSLINFMRALARADIRTRLVTVNVANQSNDVPMDLRYYGGVIAEALEFPEYLEPPLPEKWELVIQAEDSARAGRYAAAEALYRSALRLDRGNAGLHFALAVVLGFQGKAGECRTALLDAYRFDNEYLRGIFQLARVLGAGGEAGTGIEIINDPDIEKLVTESEMDYQRGMYFYTAGRSSDAVTYLQRAAGRRPNDFGLQSVLIRAYRDIGDSENESLALQRLIHIDEGRVRRQMPWVYADLGALLEKEGRTQQAAEFYKTYIDLVPTDSLSAVLREKINRLGGAGGAGRAQ